MNKQVSGGIIDSAGLNDSTREILHSVAIAEVWRRVATGPRVAVGFNPRIRRA